MSRKSDRWTLPIDAVFTVDPINPLAAMAHKIGFQIGANSKMRSIANNPERWNWQFPLTFIDCDYKKYNHETHLKACESAKPKYATVRDIMTEAQCEAAGIEYFDFDTVMKFAQDLKRFTERVIVIPKYDCLGDIPDRYVLGYSIPTKYGGTPMPMSMFDGREVHLLGGSWKKQRGYITNPNCNVVSFDNNYEWKVSVYGNFCLPDGTVRSLKDYGLNTASSPMYASMMLSLCNIATGLKEVFSDDCVNSNTHKEQLSFFEMWS
jgi:hypothetical protein